MIFRLVKNRVLKRYYKNFVFLDGTVDFAVLKIIIGKNFTYQMLTIRSKIIEVKRIKNKDIKVLTLKKHSSWIDIFLKGACEFAIRNQLKISTSYLHPKWLIRRVNSLTL